MRHVFGFVLGLVMVPAVVVVPGWALPRLDYIAGFGGDFVSATGLITVVPLMVLALLVGVCVAVRRVSALATTLPGMALVGWTGVYVALPTLAVGVLPGTEWGQGVAQLLALGVYLPFGLMLLLPMFMPSRWRRAVEDEEGFADLADEYDEEPADHAPLRGRRHAAPRDFDEENYERSYRDSRVGHSARRR